MLPGLGLLCNAQSPLVFVLMCYFVFLCLCEDLCSGR